MRLRVRFLCRPDRVVCLLQPGMDDSRGMGGGGSSRPRSADQPGGGQRPIMGGR